MKFQLLPRLQENEIEELTESIRRFGVKVPIVIDEDGEIIDGHHRVMIADSLGIEYPKAVENGHTPEAKRILAAQLNVARRHMSLAQRVQLGREIEPDIAAEARRRQAAAGELYGRGKDSSGSHDPELSGNPVRTRDEVARTVGLGSGITYERNRALLEEIEQEEDGPALIEHVKSGDWDMDDVRAEIKTRKNVHVSNNSGENEWYTPAEYIEAARDAMGGIDLDPASNPMANGWIQATTYYTKDDNGLSQSWHGRVWLNPPYAQPLIQHFAGKVVEEYTEGNIDQAIVLVNNATETRWFQVMAQASTAMCFRLGRIKYLDVTGKPANTPLQGQAFLYFGQDADRFREGFERFGVVR